MFPENISFTTALIDLVGPNSAFFFNALKIECVWLAEPVADWCSIPAFQRAFEKIQTLKVVNDVGERMVRLTSDFLPFAKDGNNFQDLLQVVEKPTTFTNLRAKKSVMSDWVKSA